MSKLDSDVKDTRLQELDDYDEEAAKAAAKQSAKVAAKKAEYTAHNWDQRCGADVSLAMSEAAETAGDRPQPDIFQVHSSEQSLSLSLCSLSLLILSYNRAPSRPTS